MMSALGFAGANLSSASQLNGLPTATVVTRFAPLDLTFTESMATDRQGAMYVSKTVWSETGSSNHGRILKVTTAGKKSFFSQSINLGPTGMLTGVARSPHGRLYVAAYDWGKRRPTGVYRVTPDRVRLVATVPKPGFPNAMAFHDGGLYVTDSLSGVVWRLSPGGAVQHLTNPWLAAKRLQPSTAEGLGVNGLAFRQDTLFMVNHERGILLKAHVGRTGHPGALERVTTDRPLKTADGLAFDRQGRLWVTLTGSWDDQTSSLQGQSVVHLTRSGHVLLDLADAPFLNYPTVALPGRTSQTRGLVYVLDGAFDGGRAKIVSFENVPG